MSLPFKRKKWNKEDLFEAVKSSRSIRQVIGKLGLVEAGGNYDQVKKWIKEFNIDTSHFLGQGWNKDGINLCRTSIHLKDILKKDTHFQSFKLKNKLFRAGIKNRECEICGWCKKSSDGRIPLELDHINGIKTDNRLENLRILCPNCHSLQPTHRGKNKRNR